MAKRLWCLILVALVAPVGVCDVINGGFEYWSDHPDAGDWAYIKTIEDDPDVGWISSTTGDAWIDNGYSGYAHIVGTNGDKVVVISWGQTNTAISQNLGIPFVAGETYTFSIDIYGESAAQDSGGNAGEHWCIGIGSTEMSNENAAQRQRGALALSASNATVGPKWYEGDWGEYTVLDPPDIFAEWQTRRVSYTATPEDAGKEIVVFFSPGFQEVGADRDTCFDNARLIIGPLDPAVAVRPGPTNGATDVGRTSVLTWSPGMYAPSTKGHRIYFSDVLAEVEQGLAAADRGIHDQPEYDTDTLDLDYAKTYYWRVDEVNAPPSNAVHPGSVWSFTVEPLAVPVETVTATASGANPDMGPERTIDGSGLNDMDQHSVDSLDMWLVSGANPWIQYEFDKAYKLHAMRVWNSNQVIEAFLGFGVKETTVEYSVDGNTWTALDGHIELAQAPGLPTYEVNTTVAFGDVMAKFVRLSVVSPYGFTGQSGLAEVRFLAIGVLPREPQPVHGATSSGVDVQVTWRSGREATSHEVLLSTDADAIINGTAPVNTVSVAAYDAGILDYGTTYHWQVTEVNEAAVPTAHRGELWSFMTPEYGMVDDFESYSGEEGQEVFVSWWDGFGGDVSLGGSTTGHVEGPFVETGIVHGGKQSLPIFFDNNGGFSNIDNATNAPRFSEVLREFNGLDLTEGNAQVLAVSFRGNPAGFVEQAGTLTLTASGADIWGTADEFRYAYQRLSGDGSMVARVQSLETVDAWSKAGVMIRDSLHADSAFAMMVATGTEGITFQYRDLGGGSAEADNGDRDAAADPAMNQDDEPVWVRMDRVGSDFYAYWSLDGTNWSPSVHNPQTIQMGASIYVGLGVTSHSSGNATTAVFTDVSTTGNVTGAFTAEVIGAEAMPTNDGTDPLYLVVKDSTGHTVTVTHPDATAIQSGDWQDWLIPVSELTSLKENNIKAITIGVGYKDGSQVGSEGVLYLDDLRIGSPR